MSTTSTYEKDARLLMDIFRAIHDKQNQVQATNRELAKLSGLPVHRVICAIVFANSMGWLSRTSYYYADQPGLRRVMQIHWDVFGK